MKRTLTPLIASSFLSDGGNMFGIVPKALWNNLIPADEHNRIAQRVNTLLIEWEDGRRALLDVGCGAPDKFSEKARKINGVNEWPLMEQLKALNIAPDSITDLLLTHLHWDHIGGAVAANGQAVFPEATLHVHEMEWEDAHSKDPLLHKAYPPEVVDPLPDLYPLNLLTDQQAVPLPGIRFERTGGHTRGHCVIEVEGDLIWTVSHPEAQLNQLQKVVYTGDAVSTHHHLRMVFHPAYDLFPLQTRTWKHERLPELAQSETLLVYGHDAQMFGSRLKMSENTRIAPELPIVFGEFS